MMDSGDFKLPSIDGIEFVNYTNEEQLDDVMRLVSQDLSEPYSSRFCLLQILLNIDWYTYMISPHTIIDPQYIQFSHIDISYIDGHNYVFWPYQLMMITIITIYHPAIVDGH